MSVGLLGLAVALSVPAELGADTMVQTFTDEHLGVLLGPTDQLLELQPFSFSQAVNQFNPALGSLNAITIAYSFDFVVEGTTGPTGGGISGGIGGPIDWGGDRYTNNGGGNGNGAGLDTPVQAPFNAAGSRGFTLGSSNPAHFTNATGTGTVTWEWRSDIADDQGADLNAEGLGTATGVLRVAADSLTVTYDYEASIPEPSALALLGLALVGLCGHRAPRRG